MADLVSIGVSGLSAYQNALAVTSNNIANINTPGYTEEQAILAPAGLSGNDVISIGDGVITQSISRLSNSFLESNLREATAAVGAQNSLVQGLSQLQNEIGSSTAGLSTQLQSFFNSVSSLQANPSDAGTRASFFATAQSTAEQFNSVGSTIQNLSADAVTQIDNSVGTVNGILQQIYSVNQEINQHASDKNPPATLLDQRDSLLTQLSQNMGISTQYSDSGAVSVYAGNSATGPVLVDSTQTNTLSAVVDPNNNTHVSFVLNQASNPQTISPITSGVIGGYVNFLSQGIAPTMDQINRIANTFGSAINAIQTNGMDANGNIGQPMFYLGPEYAASGPAIAGSENLNVTMANPAQVTGNSYTAVFDGSSGQWKVTDSATGAETSGSGDIQFEGLNFSFTGAAVSGDEYTINPTSTAAQAISLAISDPNQIATASQVQVSADLVNNKGTATATATVVTPPLPPAGIKDLSQVISYFTNGSGSSTYIAPSATNKTIAYIPAGTTNVNLSSGSGEFAVFTRDGVQLSGPAVTDTSFMTTANGFNAGAAANYSTTYLNQTGVNGGNSYLGQSYTFGQTANPVQNLDLNGNPINGSYSPATISTGPIVAGQTLAAGSLSINGQPFPPTAYTLSTASALAQELSTYGNVTATANGNTVQITQNITAQAAQASNYTLTLTPSGGASTTYSGTTIADLVASINASTTSSGASATVGSASDPINLSVANGTVISNNNVGLPSEAVTSATTQPVVANISGYSINLNGQTVTASSDTDLLSKINSNTALKNSGVTASYDASGNISITDQLTANLNGTNFTGANADELISSINSQAQVTGVSATLNTDGTIGIVSSNSVLTVGNNNLGISANSYSKNTTVVGNPLAENSFTIGANNLGIAPGSSTSVTGNNYYVMVNGYRYSSPTLQGLQNVINSTGSGITASDAGNGFAISKLDTSAAPVTFLVGANNLGISQAVNAAASPLSISLNGSDTSDLALTNIGLSPGFQMSQPLAEDLLVVSVNNTNGMTIQGSYQQPSNDGSAASTSTAANNISVESLPASQRNWEIKFSADGTHYSILDTTLSAANPTQYQPTVVVSNGTFNPSNPTISYGNWSTTFTGTPQPNDTYYVNPTQGPNASVSYTNGEQNAATSLSDNSNIAQMAAVASNTTYFGNNQTLEQAYTATVNDIGAKLSQAQTAQTTQQAVLTQAQSARDQVSGVNMDTELANMIKYQQAYQASSKIVSTAMTLFDYLIQNI